MKYHARIFVNSKQSVCGVKIKPDTFVYEAYAFKAHFAKGMACKKCHAYMTKLSNNNPYKD